jgi:hypothetical protein
MLNSCIYSFRSVRKIWDHDKVYCAIRVRKPKLPKLIVSCDYDFSILSDCHSVASSARYLREIDGLVVFRLYFHRSKGILLSSKSSGSIEALTPCEKFSIIHKHSRVIPST